MIPALDVTVVVPVKPWRLAKSRLAMSPDARATLARAFASDVLETVSMSRHVGAIVVVTAEQELHADRSSRVTVLVDRPMLSPDGLNPAIDTARRWAVPRRQASPFVVVPADLPALTVESFDHALLEMRHHEAAFVPDLAGTGTTLTWGRSPDLRTRYGPGSAVSHMRSGMRAVMNVDSRVRCDVDTSADLTEARYLGVGRSTLAALGEPGTGRTVRVNSATCR